MLFISPQKLFLFSRYLIFCLNFLVMQQNGLIRKIRLITKFLTSQPGLQKILMYILPNISKSKCNQTMKFDHLMECKIRNIFLEQSFTKCDGETSPRLFSDKLKLNTSLNQELIIVLNSLLLLYTKFRAIEIY